MAMEPADVRFRVMRALEQAGAQGGLRASDTGAGFVQRLTDAVVVELMGDQGSEMEQLGFEVRGPKEQKKAPIRKAKVVSKKRR